MESWPHRVQKSREVTGISTLAPVQLTNGHAAVGAAEVDVALRDGRHANLVESPRVESCKSAAEGYGPVACGTAHGDAHLWAEEEEGGQGAQGPSWGRGGGSPTLVTVSSPPCK